MGLGFNISAIALRGTTGKASYRLANLTVSLIHSVCCAWLSDFISLASQLPPYASICTFIEAPHSFNMLVRLKTLLSMKYNMLDRPPTSTLPAKMVLRRRYTMSQARRKSMSQAKRFTASQANNSPAQKLVRTKTSSHGSLCTEQFLHAEVFTYREAFTQRSFYTQKLLHYTQKLLHTGASTHRSFYTEKPFTQSSFALRSFSNIPMRRQSIHSTVSGMPKQSRKSSNTRPMKGPNMLPTDF